MIRYDRITVRQACRATSAAPGFFRSQKITYRQWENGVEKEVEFSHMDGGAGMNNPTIVAWNEVQSLRRQDNSSSTTSTREQEEKALKKANKGLTIVSFGTGIPKPPSFFSIGKRVTDTEAVHLEMKDSMTRGDVKPDHYFRFNVARGLIKIPMDKFVDSTISDIDEIVDAAFQHPKGKQELDMNQDLRTLATKLVLKRLRRMKHEDMWRRITDCYLHGCNHCGHESFGDNNGVGNLRPINSAHFAKWYSTFEDLKEHVLSVKQDERWVDEYWVEHEPFHAKGPW